MDDAGLGCIVCCLQLRDINDMPAHTCGRDEAPSCKPFQLLSIQIGTLFLLTSPMCAGRSSTIKGAVKISSNDLMVVVDLSVKHCALTPWDTSISNKNIQPAVKFFYNLGDGLLDMLCVSHVDLIRLALREKLVSALRFRREKVVCYT